MADQPYEYNAATGAYAPVAAAVPVPTPVPVAAPVMAAPAQPKKNTGYVVAIVLLSIALFFALGFAGCSAMLTAGSAFGSKNAGFVDPTVAVIDIQSTIEYGNGPCGPEGLAALIAQAEANDAIKAIVLHVNSGGGTAAAGEEMAKIIAACSKPVVVSSAATNASAAYEISSQADYIFVNKATFIGSIGTALQFVDYSGLYDKLGIKYTDVVSADSKDASYGNRALTPDELAYYQHMVTQVNESFIETVAAGRGMTLEAVRALATGNLFTGPDAIELGLADALGTYEDALDYAAGLGGITGVYSVVNISYTGYDFGSLLDLFMEDGTELTADELRIILTMGETKRAVGYSGAYAAQ